MKFDLTTSIIAGIVGVVAAFFITRIFIPATEPFSYKTLTGAPSTTLTDPNPEIFNYRAINPTVEVYVGQCAEYNEQGECISNITSIGDDTITTDTNNNTDSNVNTNPDLNFNSTEGE